MMQRTLIACALDLRSGLCCTQAVLGPSALPSQSKFLQEVAIYPPGSVPLPAAARSATDADVAVGSWDSAASIDGETQEGAARFMWVLQLRPDHCWIVADIVPAAIH